MGWLEMITTRIREVAEKRKIKSGYQLGKLLGLSPSMAARLWKDDVKMIDLTTLNRLCRELRCKPSDILHYELDTD
jgi:DNA-binding Xre family transcriptional regulator